MSSSSELATVDDDALRWLRTTGEAILDQVELAVVGKRQVCQHVLASMLAGGHVLLEDVPGLGKTLLARAFATACGLQPSRIQFTPDLLPGDVTGSGVYHPGDGTVEFRPGPVFANLVIADEINRAPPKTQAALLEAMQECQVTVEGVTRALPRPFCVVATQNPVEFEGTYPLPEAQLDRFLLRLSIGYPQHDDETAMLTHRVERRAEEVALEAVVDASTFRRMQQIVESVHVDGSIAGYIVDLVAASRRRPELVLGASPRGSLAVLGAARATAALAGRDFVTPDDVQAVIEPALSHRLALTPDRWTRGVRAADVIEACRQEVPMPVTQPER